MYPTISPSGAKTSRMSSAGSNPGETHSVRMTTSSVISSSRIKARDQRLNRSSAGFTSSSVAPRIVKPSGSSTIFSFSICVFILFLCQISFTKETWFAQAAVLGGEDAAESKDFVRSLLRKRPQTDLNTRAQFLFIVIVCLVDMHARAFIETQCTG